MITFQSHELLTSKGIKMQKTSINLIFFFSLTVRVLLLTYSQNKFILFIQILQRTNRRMGCGVAMTVLQTRELIKIESNLKASKSNLRTTNNLVKVNISDPSKSVVQVNTPKQSNHKNPSNLIQKDPQPKQNHTQINQQIKIVEQKKDDKLEHIQKIEQPIKQTKQNSNPPKEAEKVKDQKSPRISSNQQIQKPKSIPQNNAVISDKPNAKVQSTKIQKPQQITAKVQIKEKKTPVVVPKTETKGNSMKSPQKKESLRENKQEVKTSSPIPKISQQKHTADSKGEPIGTSLKTPQKKQQAIEKKEQVKQVKLNSPPPKVSQQQTVVASKVEPKANSLKSPQKKPQTPRDNRQQLKSNLPLPEIRQQTIRQKEIKTQPEKTQQEKLIPDKSQEMVQKKVDPPKQNSKQIQQQTVKPPQDVKPDSRISEKRQSKAAEPISSKTQFIQIQSINRNTPPTHSSRLNISSKVNISRNESSKNLNKDLTRKSLKVKKGMVPVDSLFLQSVITKPEEPELEKQNSSRSPQTQTEKKQDVSINVPKVRKSKNEPIQIVDDLKQMEKNLQKTNILTTKSKVPSTKREVTPNLTEQSITRITAQKKKAEEERKAEQMKKKTEQQLRKAEEAKKIQQAKRKLQLEEKKNIEKQASRLKKVYNV